MSYPSLTELTRNPPETRGPIEKNWMFFSNRQASYIHYDIAPGERTFAKLLGSGLTTVNLTDPMELSCINAVANQKKVGSWHQSTNSLRLILCERSDTSCEPNAENTVFFSMIHHKIKGHYGLPIRYERYFIVWSAIPPFSMLGISQHAMLMANETATGWSEEENWADDEDNRRRLAKGQEGKPMFATFTYTVSIAYAWGRKDDSSRDKNVGYLDDEVVVGVGIDDGAQMYARVKARDLLQCLRACPGRAAMPMDLANAPSAAQLRKDTKEKLADVINVGAGPLPQATVSSAEKSKAEATKTSVASDVKKETSLPALTSATGSAATSAYKLPVSISSKPSNDEAERVALSKEEGAAPPPLPNRGASTAVSDKTKTTATSESTKTPPSVPAEAAESSLPAKTKSISDDAEAGEVGANPPTLADEKEKAKAKEGAEEALRAKVAKDKDRGT